MQPNKIMYIDLPDPLPKSYAPKMGEEMNRSTYSTMRYNDKTQSTKHIGKNQRKKKMFGTHIVYWALSKEVKQMYKNVF